MNIVLLTFSHLRSPDSADIEIVAHELNLMLQHVLVVPPRSHLLLSTTRKTFNQTSDIGKYGDYSYYEDFLSALENYFVEQIELSINFTANE